ncbi:hypothetical protein KIN20_019913 [Parelaphostrongylus tenuis]|uniref:Uncharacterized protein n=1 Tax=Parelaphostrongylus tenuis TaxID=148309 RepID=A0AAD5N5Y2_PARTN|nr:hypothetical protein KIN20_019913 [Parelaphostrongylus tenuis]
MEQRSMVSRQKGQAKGNKEKSSPSFRLVSTYIMKRKALVEYIKMKIGVTKKERAHFNISYSVYFIRNTIPSINNRVQIDLNVHDVTLMWESYCFLSLQFFK